MNAISDSESLAGMIDRFTTEQAAGQFLVLGFDGTRYDAALGSWFKRFRPGGVILFARNIESATQTAGLVSDIKKLSEDITGLAPFIAVDQEGGRVSRLPHDTMAYIESDRQLWEQYPHETGFPFPPAGSLGADGSVELTELSHRAMGMALKALGFNVDYAPVLDMDTNSENPVIGDRSFSSGADDVISLGRAAIRGLKEAGMMTCAKHFPGHGGVNLDSHFDLPEDNRSVSRFEDEELRPFQMGVEEKVEFIMTAHVVYRAYDSKYPATLSKRIVTGLLREEMGYDGVIVTDDLDMKAVADQFGDDEAARLALGAGCDQALICKPGPRQLAAFETIRDMIDSNGLPEDEVKRKLVRLLALKARI